MLLTIYSCWKNALTVYRLHIAWAKVTTEVWLSFILVIPSFMQFYTISIHIVKISWLHTKAHAIYIMTIIIIRWLWIFYVAPQKMKHCKTNGISSASGLVVSIKFLLPQRRLCNHWHLFVCPSVCLYCLFTNLLLCLWTVWKLTDGFISSNFHIVYICQNLWLRPVLVKPSHVPFVN